MNKLSLALVLTLTLAACASKVDPKAQALADAANKAIADGGDSGGGDAKEKKLVTLECPLLDGKYAPKDNANGKSYVLASKLEDGKYSYSINGLAQLYPADGNVTKIDDKSSIQVSCDAESVTIVEQDVGNEAEAQTTKFSIVQTAQNGHILPQPSKTELKVERTIGGQSFSEILTKVE